MESQTILWHKGKYFGLKHQGPQWTAHSEESAMVTDSRPGPVSPLRLNNPRRPRIATGVCTLFHPFFLKTFNTIFYMRFSVGKGLPGFSWNLTRKLFILQKSTYRQHYWTALDIGNLHAILNVSAWIRTWGLALKRTLVTPLLTRSLLPEESN